MLLLLFSATSPHESARTRRAPHHRAHRSPCPVHTCIEIVRRTPSATLAALRVLATPSLVRRLRLSATPHPALAMQCAPAYARPRHSQNQKPKPKCINVYFWGCYYHQHTPAPLPGWGTVARAATLYLVPVQNYTWHAPLLGTPSGAQRPAASAAPPQHINIDRRPAAEIHDSVDSVPGASRRWPWRTLLQPAQREIGHSLRAALPTFRRMRRDDASRTSAQAPPRQRDPPPQIPSHHHTTKTPRTRHDAHKQQHNSTLYRRPPVNSKSPRAPSMPTPVHTTTRQRSSVEQARAPRQSRTNLGPQRPSAISRAPPTPQCDTGPPPTGHASTQSRTNLGHDMMPALCNLLDAPQQPRRDSDHTPF